MSNTPATVDNLLAQMKQVPTVLNGWDVVFNLLEEPVNAIFQMEFTGTANAAWKQVTVAFCQTFPNPEGGGLVAVYTGLDVTLSQPLLQFAGNNQAFANIHFQASGTFKTGIKSVPANFNPATDGNPGDPAIHWTVSDVQHEMFSARVPLTVVQGGISGGPDKYAVTLNFPAGSFESPVFNRARDGDRLREQVKQYFVTNNVEYVINRVNTVVLNQLPSLTPTAFKLNTVTTNVGKNVLELYITTDGTSPASLTINVNEPIPDGYDFSLMINRRIAAELGGASARQVSLFTLENLLFPGQNLVNLGPEYVPGDMLVLGTLNLQPRITKLTGDNQAQARAGFDPPGGTANFAPIQMLVKNALDAPLPGQPVTLTAGNHPPGMAVQVDPGGARSATVTTDGNGVATFNQMVGNSVSAYYDIGSFTLIASVPQGPSVSFSFNVLPTQAPPILPGVRLSIVSGNGQKVARTGFDPPGGIAHFGPLQVAVNDSKGHVVPNAEVNFAPGSHPPGMAVQVDPSGASPTVVISNAQGIATLNKMSGNGVYCYYDIGNFQVVASVAGGGSATFAMTVEPTPPPPVLSGLTLAILSGDRQRVSRTGSDVPGGIAQFAPLQISVRNSANQPVPNVAVNFAPGSHPGGMAVQVDPSGASPATVLTDQNGVATLNKISGHGVYGYYATGDFTVLATVPGNTPVAFRLAVV